VPGIGLRGLLVCLIHTIGGLLSAIGIAGMDRVMQHNVLAMSGKAVEAAGDVNTLLLDRPHHHLATGRPWPSYPSTAPPRRNWPIRSAFSLATKRPRAARL